MRVEFHPPISEVRSVRAGHCLDTHFKQSIPQVINGVRCATDQHSGEFSVERGGYPTFMHQSPCEMQG